LYKREERAVVNVKKDRPKLYVLDNGKMQMDKNLMVAMSNQATIDDPHAPNEMEEFPIYTVFIDHPDAKILFDTACNPNAMGVEGRWIEQTQKAFPYSANEECYLYNRLEQIGVDAKEVDYVVASHLHLDHAGCLEYFTNATVIVNDDELNGTMQVYVRKQKEVAYKRANNDALIKNNLTTKTIKQHEVNIELVEGVKSLNFGSRHAWGMLGLFVELEEIDSIILASDAIYTSESLGPPLKAPGIIYDSIGWSRSVERIKRLAKENNADIWFGHDSDQFAEYRKSTEGYYE